MNSQSSRLVSFGGNERLERRVEMMVPAFVGDPFVTWQLSGFDVSGHAWLLPKLFRTVFTACAMCRGIFYEVDDYASRAVLVPPGKNIDDTITNIRSGGRSAAVTAGLAASQCMALTYPTAKKKAIRSLFTKEEQKAYWYIYIMGTKEARRRQGLAGDLLVEMKKKSQQDGRPMYIEATTTTSRDLYLKHGFAIDPETVYILGKGKVDTAGLPMKNGPGVTLWPMVWRPTKEGPI